ncbi:hypothetical protein [Caulifigura coniformis]|uniref:hypothetical protein n=1 Tax=Caulifigura coniformis TaxID=2527983 RepID=UPI0011A80BC6|nr:hypothetical protein [Caulifigura coniformis]
MNWISLLAVTLGTWTSIPARAAEPGTPPSGANREATVELFRDDFSRFPPGMLSRPLGFINGAIQEYHYLANRGVPLGPWGNSICYMDCWAAGSDDGKPYLDQILPTKGGRMMARLFAPLFVTGEPEWSDYTVEVTMTPKATDDIAGLVFRYHTNRHHYLFSLQEGKARLAIRMPLEDEFRVSRFRELAAADFASKPDQAYRLKVENRGPEIRAYVDDVLVVKATSDELLSGKTGITANVQARFQDFRVTATSEASDAIARTIATRNQDLKELQAQNPQPKLWKKFSTPRFGAGRNMRFGDLDGDGSLDILIAQNIPQTPDDKAVEIGCMTALTSDGRILWQRGEPDPGKGLLTSDTPFQVHDLDGDGKNEVVVASEKKLLVLDGRTGEVLKSADTPRVESYPAVNQKVPDKWPTNVSSADCLAFVDFSGRGHRGEIVVKDRYWNFWVYDSDLKPLWKGQGMTGHYPYAFPGGEGGRDLLAIGYALWDGAGKQLWSADPAFKDHADSIVVGNFSGDPKQPHKAYYCGSDEGFIVINHRGLIERHVRVGHAQAAAVGKFRRDLPGLQFMTVNFWKNPGIVSLFDHEGELLQQEEPHHCGSPMLPVNWRGDGQEFVLLSGNVREGGLLDGSLRRAVIFPDDGHPDLCAEVRDMTGDARDEIVLWDQDRVWIYTQDRPFTGDRIYAPKRNPDCNDSNYRCNLSLPDWKPVSARLGSN